MAMIVTPPLSLLPQKSGPCDALGTRAALHDSTNTSLRAGKRSTGHIQPYSTKRVTFPTSSVRLHESNSRCRKLSVSPPRFPVAYKAPPTVSISFSAACSQSRGIGFEAKELELPDVCNVVPFPCSPLDGNEDVEMIDETRCPRASNGLHLCSPHLTPSSPLPSLRRKRRSACSTPSSAVPPSRRDKSSNDPKDGSVRKRARKNRRHGVEMWWLGVIHRSILQGLGESEPTASSCPTSMSECNENGNGKHQRMRSNTFEAQDRLLAGRIWQKLHDGGCLPAAMIDDREGKTATPSPSRLALSSSPPTPITLALMPSPILASPAPAIECRAEPENMSVILSSSNEVTVLEFPRPPCPAASVLHYPKPSTPISVPPLRNLLDNFHTPSWPLSPVSRRDPFVPLPSPEHTPTPLSSNFRRPPSPPLLPCKPHQSQSTTPTPQTPTTLTMPQLIASLTLAHRERGGLRSRGRSLKSSSKRSSKSTANGAYCIGKPASQEKGAFVEEDKEGIMIACARRPVDRRSPLCRIAYVENSQPSCPC
ncbi:hypothetical protein V8B97DRAFT_1559430 [Scleroderma yunnanense]